MTPIVDEGYIKYKINWTEAVIPALPQTKTLCDVRNKVYQQGWVGFDTRHNVGYGNLSVRIEEAPLPFLVTGTQTGHIETLKAEHLSKVIEVDFDRNALVCLGPVKASSESLTHAAFYALNRSEIGAVIHIHNPLLWYRLLEENKHTPAGIAYGTPEMATAIQILNLDRKIPAAGLLAMSGHEDGVIAWGTNPEHAYLQIVEYYQAMI
jgi:L-ribulose-5-phosphate 4-epimerase